MRWFKFNRGPTVCGEPYGLIVDREPFHPNINKYIYIYIYICIDWTKL